MKGLLVLKETKDIFKNKSLLIYFIILFAVIVYSFYSAVDLYSKASIAAINNPLYAAGFEPVPGVFVPTFGGLFIVFSLIAPFILIRLIGDEKTNNTIYLLSQLPFSLKEIFVSKLSAGLIFIFTSLAAFLPTYAIWSYLGGHIPWKEIVLLNSGYFLYGLFILSVSFLASVLFRTNAQASIFALSLIILSWFLDFGKEMHIFSFLNKISEWTVTKQLKEFEEGIFSFQAIMYFFLLSVFFFIIAFLFFDFNIRKKAISVFITVLLFIPLFILNANFQYKKDISESGKNSFSPSQIEFLKKLPAIKIKVFLEPTDSRFRDYANDFLKKLKMVKTDVKLEFAEGKELKDNYGLFRYKINGHTDQTYSNSSHEIFMVLQNLSGIKIEKTNDRKQFKGYPLFVKKRWSLIIIVIYFFVFPVIILLYQIKKPRRGKDEA